MTASDYGKGGEPYCFSRAGFTLIEVMVAMAIIATVMVSLFRMQSGTISLAGADEFQTAARFLAARALTSIELSIDDPPDKGEFEGAFKGYEWSCEIVDVSFQPSDIMPDSDKAGEFKKIELTITRTLGNRSYHVETYRYAPGE